MFGSERHETGAPAHDVPKALQQIRARDVDLSPHPDPHAVLLPELPPRRDPELVRQHRVVADLGVHVQGKVRAVQRDVVLQESRDASISASGEWLEAAPKKPVMHQQEIGALLCRHAHGGFAQVHGGRCSTHRAAVRHLQPVERVGRIGNVGDPQVAIEVRDQGGQLDRGHQASQDGDIIAPDYRQ